MLEAYKLGYFKSRRYFTRKYVNAINKFPKLTETFYESLENYLSQIVNKL